MSDQKLAISQTAIKDWKNLSPRQWYDCWVLRKRKFRGSESMEFGSLLDCLLFTPDDFDKKFIMSTSARPSDKVALICKGVFDAITELNENATKLNEESKTAQGDLFKDKEVIQIPMKEYSLEQNKDIVCKLAKENDFWANQPERAYSEVIKNGKNYFDFLITAGRRIVITPEQKALAIELKNILQNDPVSRGFFIPKKGCEVIFQKTIFAEFDLGLDTEGVDFLLLKGVPDIIHINHTRKEIREVDLKYTASAYLFWERIRQFDYPLQHSFYDYLLRSWAQKADDGKYKDYVIMPPLNVVIDDEEKIPYIYAYNVNDLYIKRFGIEGTKITGWEDTLKDIAWHLGTNEWKRPKEHVKNGYLSVNVFNKR